MLQLAEASVDAYSLSDCKIYIIHMYIYIYIFSQDGDDLYMSKN